MLREVGAEEATRFGPLPPGGAEDARDDRPPAGLAGTAVLGTVHDALTRLLMALDQPPQLLSLN